MNKQILYTGIVLGVVIGSALGGTLGYRLGAPQPDKVAEIKLDDTLKPVGLISTDTAISIILPDGKQLPVSGRKQEFNVDYYLVSGKWVKM
jgi:hypothetical protein